MTPKTIAQLIEPHLQKNLIQKDYKLKNIKAKELLVHTRFDLAFKLLYLENIDKKSKFSKEIYIEHIRAFSLGEYTERGNKEKNNISRFIEDFHNTFENIKTNGFDSSKTLIPLSKNGSIANGAHRVASAIYVDKNVECIDTNTTDPIYDYKFFYNRNVSTKILDVVATKFIEYADNVYLAFIWPSAQGYDKEIEEVIPNIVYKKEITLNLNGAHNLLSQIYYGEKWVGSKEDNFRGSQGKLVECFRSFDPVRVVAFQANNLDEVLVVKDKIRAIFNIGKNSIHITDTKNEAIRVARVVLNDNSIHFLNHAKLSKYISTFTKIDKFKKFIKENKLNKSEVLIDSSLILSCYGLREAKDTDFFCSDESKIKVRFDNINIHDEVLKYYQETKQELIYNPKNYFYFNELKFVSFYGLYKMKKNRAEIKDKNDCKMMEAFMEKDEVKMIINKFNQNFYYGMIKVRHNLILFLDYIGLKKIIKKSILYQFIKK